MSIVITLTQGTTLPASVLTALGESDYIPLILRASAGQPACPWCASATGLRPTSDTRRYECWHCFVDCWVTLLAPGLWRSASQDVGDDKTPR